MPSAREPQPGPPADAPSAGDGAARLNLLLTYGGWRTDSWADRLPQMLAPMGVRVWRAASGREAADLIRSMRVHVAVVDFRLPLDRLASAPEACAPSAGPEEGGARILEILSRLDQPPPTLVVKRGRTSREDAREAALALNMGAFAAIDRPVDLERMLDAMRRVLARHYHGRWPGDGPRSAVGFA